MPKINVSSAYLNHPKTRRLKLYCGPEADIYPIRLWLFCAEYFPKDGIFKGYSNLEIEAIAGWNGVQGNLIRALEQCGFVEKVDSTYKIHDWKIHAGFLHTYSKKGREMARKRWKSNVSVYSKNHAVSIAASNAIEKNRIEKNKDSIANKTSQTHTPVDNSVDNLNKAKRSLTGVQKIVLAYKILSGYDQDDAAWNKLNFSRCSRSAKQLLDFFGDWADAVDCVQDVYERLTGKGLTVTLETVAKHAADWKKNKREKEGKRGIFPVPGHGNSALNA